jgi:hypothetical protein
MYSFYDCIITLADTFHAQSFKSALLPHFNKCLNSPEEKNPDDDDEQTSEEDECRNKGNELPSDLYVRKTEHNPDTSSTLQSVCNLFTYIKQLYNSEKYNTIQYFNVLCNTCNFSMLRINAA